MSRTRRSGLRRLWSLVALATAGCGGVTYELQAVPLPPLEDRSASSSALGQRSYQRVMVLPATGSGRVLDAELAGLERALLQRGLTVVAPATSARVVFDEEHPETQRRGGGELSDLERTLLLGRAASAQVVLQVQRLAPDGLTRRLFVATRGVAPMREVGPDDWGRAAPAWRWALEAPLLCFTGRLIDVRTGEVLAVLELEGRLLDALPATYLARLRPDAQAEGLALVEESFPFGGPEAEAEWVAGARARVTEQMFDAVAAAITQGRTLPAEETVPERLPATPDRPR